MNSLAPPTPVSASAIEAKIWRMCPLYEHIDLRVESIGDTVACTVPLTVANTNHLGGMHAAVQWAVAEAVGGVGFFAHPELGECWLAVRDVTISFVTVATTALRAEARFDAAQVASIAAQLTDRQRANYEVECVLRDTSGQVVTTATGHYHLRRSESDVNISAAE